MWEIDKSGIEIAEAKEKEKLDLLQISCSEIR